MTSTRFQAAGDDSTPGERNRMHRASSNQWAFTPPSLIWAIVDSMCDAVDDGDRGQCYARIEDWLQRIPALPEGFTITDVREALAQRLLGVPMRVVLPGDGEATCTKT